ncbi:MAG: hypothetical protein KGJ23_09440 [Euryarchaeota archaeon]|nr:hypothetical protein [Euryarchaeota archaeon]MDE1836826.1 hypothetical protein [Euryarchaeota archaeon]MDE1881729.1 hypothetical protein [Euryarchaeota archaeon]MDE2044810.1 hypothetical protein [Thermoplasmata archaeon]
MERSQEGWPLSVTTLLILAILVGAGSGLASIRANAAPPATFPYALREALPGCGSGGPEGLTLPPALPSVSDPAGGGGSNNNNSGFGNGTGAAILSFFLFLLYGSMVLVTLVIITLIVGAILGRSYKRAHAPRAPLLMGAGPPPQAAAPPCPQCGTTNRPAANFCSGCGGPLVPSGGPPRPPPATREGPRGGPP